jgi:hypothetical protein
MRTSLRAAVLAAIVLCLVVPAAVHAQPGTTYRVTITNLTQHQVFSSPVVATHAVGTGIFHVGQTVDEPFWLMAEDGEATELAAKLEADPRVGDVAVSPVFLMPGKSITLTVESHPPFFRLSAVGMLVTTNDGFFGLDSYPLDGPWLERVYAPVFDAGTEANNEDCAFVPGPPCGNLHQRDTDGAEGYVSSHPGIKGIGDLDPAIFDWRNPVAEIKIVRVDG